LANGKSNHLSLYENTTNHFLKGGFRFVANSYNDILTDPVCNRHCYDFWARKTRARIHDKETADTLAPLEPPHPFGAKRPSLEQDYYDSFNLPNIHAISVKENPIVEVVPEGIMTADGTLHKLDIIALATGFDAVTGGLKNIKITGLGGQVLADKWEKGTWTYLGMATSGFPNFFFTYGPQAPTAFSNGPACLEPQCDWIVQVLTEMREKGLKTIDTKKQAEEDWRDLVNKQSEKTLRHNTQSW
jgi:cation diffusion facilitator CzcD-associated flavoprotein CzcO